MKKWIILGVIALLISAVTTAQDKLQTRTQDPSQTQAQVKSRTRDKTASMNRTATQSQGALNNSGVSNARRIETHNNAAMRNRVNHAASMGARRK